MLCQVEDDNGTICNRPMSHREFQQDGMCGRCADLIWANFVSPLANDGNNKPIIFEN